MKIFKVSNVPITSLQIKTSKPNDKTAAAIQELEAGKGSKYDSMDGVWDDIKGEPLVSAKQLTD